MKSGGPGSCYIIDLTSQADPKVLVRGGRYWRHKHPCQSPSSQDQHPYLPSLKDQVCSLGSHLWRGSGGIFSLALEWFRGLKGDGTECLGLAGTKEVVPVCVVGVGCSGRHLGNYYCWVLSAHKASLGLQ